ncbi:MAG: sugar phosphate nucleotidyltransferase, partial [Alphaproteobacteria bacterium]|nr:sugar phosphate nucleotidyltransferase [Alphaproteobacteria bacterium]
MMALERLNACSPNSFLVVVDEAKHLCATLTDGDIRRGLLNGLALDAPISECMNTKPEVLQEADVPSASKLNRYGFLPQIDAKGCVRRIFANTSNGRRIPYAVIMAGGLGKRLHPHTLKTPKPLLPIAGRPLLARLLDKMDAANVSETLISVHYMADHFEQFVSQDKRSFTQVSLVYEEDMLGTAGCLSLLKDK